MGSILTNAVVLPMNFLGHAYLSFGHPALLTGNMISDFVKGRAQYDFIPGIQKGIRLHRIIDERTDQDPAFREIRRLFHADFRRYAGAFADVCVDFFLARDETEFPTSDHLLTFSQETYAHLESHRHHLPAVFLPVLEGMKTNNWLFHYRETWGIQKSFHHIGRRARYLDDARPAMPVLERHHQELQALYREFFPRMKSEARILSEALLAEP